ncbi:mannose-P-dolichol utilization defect 1 protein homolog [Sitodiplosis mosellana]|uniref:mannose-P-dolichol utilization defect 1 protein homolog n=1 Tax=Sitodiplosis mosellana TaxID=263140 RepID=UPI002443ACA3|nr:mannose-P-dolichol utilization defect 1 protein homolog [Sitodiplosis mosellana]
MAALFRTLALQLISQKCYETYFYENNFFDVACFKGLLSKTLGYGIVAGSLFVKVPQILKILSNKSGAGINIFAVFLELTAITLNLSYSFVKGFPFSSWGDVSFLAVQTAVIAALVLHYSGKFIPMVVFLVAYVAASYTLMGGLTSIDVLWSLQVLNIPIVIAGKMSQAWTNYSNGNTGQLSAVTCFMLFFGSAARVFTSIQETGDSLIILTYILSTLSNGVIVAQLLYYWNVGAGGKKINQKSKQTKTAKTKAKKAD